MDSPACWRHSGGGVMAWPHRIPCRAPALSTEWTLTRGVSSVKRHGATTQALALPGATFHIAKE